jgi:predicted RNase H-like HicB family nuclease
MEIIKKELTLEYWKENGWFEGRLKEVPDLLSQGQSLEELQENLREDCSALVMDTEYKARKSYRHLSASDILNADFRLVELNRFQAAVAQLQVLSPPRAEKVFAYIEDLVDLEAFEARADADEARRERPEGEKMPWEENEPDEDDDD